MNTLYSAMIPTPITATIETEVNFYKNFSKSDFFNEFKKNDKYSQLLYYNNIIKSIPLLINSFRPTNLELYRGKINTLRPDLQRAYDESVKDFTENNTRFTENRLEYVKSLELYNDDFDSHKRTLLLNFLYVTDTVSEEFLDKYERFKTYLFNKNKICYDNGLKVVTSVEFDNDSEIFYYIMNDNSKIGCLGYVDFISDLDTIMDTFEKDIDTVPTEVAVNIFHKVIYTSRKRYKDFLDCLGNRSDIRGAVNNEIKIIKSTQLSEIINYKDVFSSYMDEHMQYINRENCLKELLEED